MTEELNNSGPADGGSGRKRLLLAVGLVSVAAMIVICFFVVRNIGKGKPESGSGGYLEGLSKARIQARVAVSKSNLKMLAVALLTYEMERRTFPESLDIGEEYGISENVEKSPLDGRTPYVYVKPNDSIPPEFIMIYDPLVVEDEVLVAYISGAVKSLPVGEFKKKLAEQGVECKLIEK